MLQRGHVVVLLLFLLNKCSFQESDVEKGSEKSKLTTTNSDPRVFSEASSVHRLEPTTLTGGKPPPKQREPITINKQFAGNNGRIHKLYYVIPSSSDVKHRKRVHEVKVRLRQRRGLVRDSQSRSRGHRKRFKRLTAVSPKDPSSHVRRWRLQRLKRELKAEDLQKNKEPSIEDFEDVEDFVNKQRTQRRKELNDKTSKKHKENHKGKLWDEDLGLGVATEVFSRTDREPNKKDRGQRQRKIELSSDRVSISNDNKPQRYQRREKELTDIVLQERTNLNLNRSLQRLKRDTDSGGLDEVEIRWRERMRNRPPRDHQFVTKSQLKIDRVTSEDPPPVIKVYSATPEEGISKVIRAGKSRDFNYQSRTPMKRIIYYATLPEIIRRPTAPEWFARQSGAFNNRLLGSTFGSGLLPAFSSGPGQGVDFTRIQSALMDVRPPRDNLSPVGPQLTTLFNLDRFPSLNDITSTNSIHSSDSGNGSGGGGSGESSGPGVSGGGGGSSSNDNANSGASDGGGGGLSPLSNDYISNLVSSLNHNGLSSIQNSNSGGGSFGYQPAPYYPGPFPTRHHRFPPYPSDPYQPYIQGRNPLLRITAAHGGGGGGAGGGHYQPLPPQSPPLTLNHPSNYPPSSTLTSNYPPSSTLTSNYSPSSTLTSNHPLNNPPTLNNLANYQLDHRPPSSGDYYNSSRLSNLLSSTAKYPPYYYDYTSNRVDPLKNHLLFSPTWATAGPPTPLYERITPTTHSTHSVVIDSHTVNINATNVSTGNSTRLTPPIVTNVTQHYESHE